MTNVGTHIHDWVFHYNTITKLWNATKRDNYSQLFNGGEDVLKSSNISTLIEIINKTDGSTSLINEFINGKGN